MDKLLKCIIFRPKFKIIFIIFLLFSLNACKIAQGNPNWQYAPEKKMSIGVAYELQMLSNANYISPETKSWIDELVYQDCMRKVQKYGMADCFMPKLNLPATNGHTFVE